MAFLAICLLLLNGLVSAQGWPWGSEGPARNSTIANPMLPGFHPDPSCIFVYDWDNTFFCASSSFNAFPGVPIHASKDLQTWRLAGHVLNRREQLPGLAETNRSTSGIWAPALRFYDGFFWVVTTLVNDELPQNDSSRWDNIIFKGTDAYLNKWSDPVHFNFTGYDTSPFWDRDGKSYIVGSHAWHVSPGIQIAEANLDTGEVGNWTTLWNGTGGLAPEGPHLYFKDDYYYLMIAEGGTGLGHMETIARSKSLYGPYEANPANPILTNANTTSYFQTVGHADLFQNATSNWWAAALATRSGPNYTNYPMGRETVLTPVSWPTGDWPVLTQISGNESGWPLPFENPWLAASGPLITEGDNITFPPGSNLPMHFTHWRFPINSSYTISPPGHNNTLRLLPSVLNLTALNGNYAGPSGQTFVGRRQQDTLFTFSVDLEYDLTSAEEEEEAGVTVFLTQNHHLDMGIVKLPGNASTAPNLLRNGGGNGEDTTHHPTELATQVRFRGISYIPVPDPIVAPVPDAWGKSPKLRLMVRAANVTHYSFSVGLVGSEGETVNETVVLEANNDAVSWGFTGVILGIYCTSNGGSGKTPAYFSRWQYIPQGQIRS